MRYLPQLCLAALLLTSGAMELPAAEPTETKLPTAVVARSSDAPLREMRTDRPDATESPFTVDAGHFQIEGDFVSHTRDQRDGVRTRAWSFGATNVRWGVSQNTELGIFVTPWQREVEREPAGLEEKASGFGDIVLRGKLNLWGNEGGQSAGGLILDIKLPTAADGLGNDDVEGTIILPYTRQLGGGWELGAMTALDLRHEEAESGYLPVLVTTATVSHDVTEHAGVYLELTSEAGDGSHAATFNTGLTFSIDANTQLDVGVNLGISRAADDAQFFTGIAHRF